MLSKFDMSYVKKSECYTYNEINKRYRLNVGVYIELVLMRVTRKASRFNMIKAERAQQHSTEDRKISSIPKTHSSSSLNYTLCTRPQGCRRLSFCVDFVPL